MFLMDIKNRDISSTDIENIGNYVPGTLKLLISIEHIYSYIEHICSYIEHIFSYIENTSSISIEHT